MKAFFARFDFPIHLWVIMHRFFREIHTLIGTINAWLAFRFYGCKTGPHFRVNGRLVVRTTRFGAIEIGRKFHSNGRAVANLAGAVGPSVLQTLDEGRIRIGDNFGMSSVVISSRSSVTIGDRVSLGANARIYDHDFHALSAEARHTPGQDAAQCKSFPIMIGDDVLIGANAIVLKGVSIGARSIIGAGAVVTLREIPPDSIVAGNPARIVGTVGSGKN